MKSVLLVLETLCKRRRPSRQNVQRVNVGHPQVQILRAAHAAASTHGQEVQGAIAAAAAHDVGRAAVLDAAGGDGGGGGGSARARGGSVAAAAAVRGGASILTRVSSWASAAPKRPIATRLITAL